MTLADSQNQLFYVKVCETFRILYANMVKKRKTNKHFWAELQRKCYPFLTKVSLTAFALLQVSGIELLFAGEAFKIPEDLSNWSKHELSWAA